MRTQIATFLTLVLVAAAVILGLFVGGATLPLSLGSPAPTRALLPEPSRSPAPPIETVAPDALHVFSVGALPADHHFVLVGDAGDERLLLLDLGAKRVILVAHFEGTGAFKDARVVEISAIGSGELLIIHLRADGPNARLYIIKPVTGEVRSFTTPKSEQPRLSPDGDTIAVSRNSAEPDQNGLWLLNTSDGAGRRLTEDTGRKATRAVQWSADGKRLSVLVDTGAHTRLAVLNTSGEMTAAIEDASDARWRGSDLIYWNAFEPAPARAYDTSSTTGATREAYPAADGFTADVVEVRPRSTDLAVREHSASVAGRIAVYGSGSPTVAVADSRLVIAFWWSSDGASRLYAWSIDHGTFTVTDVLGGTVAATFCFHKQVEPPCP